MNNSGKRLMSHVRKYMQFYVLFFSIAISAGFINAQNPDSPGLKNLATKHNLLIGGATDLNHDDCNEEQLIINEFSILSNENCLKPNKTQPSRNVFDFSQSDYFVGFCKQNNIVAKGHKLIARDFYLPKWMLDPGLTDKELHDILVNHIENVMGRYKQGSEYGEIKYWDVLNEVVSEDKIYESVFKRLGKNSDGDYVYWELAFRTARAVDPHCVLIWTEDNIEFDYPKAEKLYETIKRLKAKGVPIDAVGFQCHIGFHRQPVPDFTKLAGYFQKFADLGLYIAITELDVSEKLNQVEIYKNIMQVCLDQPKCISLSTWNVVDKYSWRRNLKDAENPLLFDDNYQPKSTYFGVQEILRKPNINSKNRILPHY